MWLPGWRDQVWSQCDRPWDLIIIGGGITGAGILRAATYAGLRALLLEARDFAYGSSSRSSKLVHGGLRYLQTAQLKLTFESVRERERLLREGRGLVTSLGFVMANFDSDRMPDWVFGAGLILYDLLALRWSHRHYGPRALQTLCPELAGPGLIGGYRFIDAETDDARLVLRVIREAVRGGGAALNYARVESLLRQRDGSVCGVQVRDVAEVGAHRSAEVLAPVVINATGVWADEVRHQIGARGRLRKLRGSHLLLPAARLPVRRAVSFLHPTDQRPVFVIPWEGVTLVGTTDVDHMSDLDDEPHISSSEVEYLLAATSHAFPSLGLTASDVQATFAGVRPVVDTGKKDPSKESREHVLWLENGLLTVTGGKLTTFRLMAQAALRALRGRWPKGAELNLRQRLLDVPPEQVGLALPLDPAVRLRLAARYGTDMLPLLAAAAPGELEPVDGTLASWAEVRWAARAEGVCHLDDLLLRRVRLGLLLPGGGLAHLDRVRAIVQAELNWSDERWRAESEAYQRLWHQSYAREAAVA